MKYQKTYRMVLGALFVAIIILMTFVPNLGYINLVVIKSTLLHIPVIIGSIVLGPAMGAILGTVFGITSVINNTFNPALLSFAFSPFYSVGSISGNPFSLVIALLPRILVGIVPYYVYHGLSRFMQKGFKLPSAVRKSVALPIASFIGSAVNTLLVMNLIYLGFMDEFAAAKDIALTAVYGSILGIILANGIPEAIIAAVLASAISAVLLKTPFVTAKR
ncbi:MAG: ECF transporter S component [Clostridium sp.]|jgi:uncharacterized membrane protein|nr:ECF transporter S component [Clostridium sp.]